MLTTIRNKMLASSIQVSVVAILIGIILLMGKRLTVLSQENNRLQNNVAASRSMMEELQTENGRPMYQNESLNLRVKELSILYPQLLDEIRNLKVKPSRVKNVSQSVIGQSVSINAKLQDSVVNDSTKVKTIHASDQWSSVTGMIDLDSAHLTVETVDTLIQVVFKGERERPWLWIFSPRKLMQRIALSNPHSRIIYSQTIKVQKRKGNQ